MQIFMALDQYDDVIRACASRELAEGWLRTRAESQWSEEGLNSAKWSDSGRGEYWLVTIPSVIHPEGMQWPYRILEQEMME